MTKEEFASRIEGMMRTLYSVCYAQLRQRCDREDAVQEALRKCWQKRDQLRDERYFNTWVIRILINECHNIQRQSARTQPAEIDLMAMPAGGVSRVGEALLMLEEKLRMPVVLHYMEGYSVAEIAHALRIPQGTVKTRLRKGRMVLKEILTSEIGGVVHEAI